MQSKIENTPEYKTHSDASSPIICDTIVHIIHIDEPQIIHKIPLQKIEKYSPYLKLLWQGPMGKIPTEPIVLANHPFELELLNTKSNHQQGKVDVLTPNVLRILLNSMYVVDEVYGSIEAITAALESIPSPVKTRILDQFLDHRIITWLSDFWEDFHLVQSKKDILRFGQYSTATREFLVDGRVHKVYLERPTEVMDYIERANTYLAAAEFLGMDYVLHILMIQISTLCNQIAVIGLDDLKKSTYWQEKVAADYTTLDLQDEFWSDQYIENSSGEEEEEEQDDE